MGFFFPISHNNSYRKLTCLRTRAWVNRFVQSTMACNYMPSAVAPCVDYRKAMPIMSHLSSKSSKIRSLRMIKCVASGDPYFSQDRRPIMLFDGACNLCNGGVKFVRENDTKRKLRFEPLQSQAGRELLVRSGRSPDDISSVVLVEQDRSFIKSNAVLRIFEYLDLPLPQISVLLNLFPLFLRDAVYDAVANNRYAIFGKSSSCSIN